MLDNSRKDVITNGYLGAVGWFARPFVRAGIGPFTFTFTGLVLALVAGGFFWTGHLIIGGILLFLAGVSDSVDGAIARASGKVTRFGAILDSTLDRYAEFAFFLGFYGYLGYSHARFVGFFQLIAIIALLGSVMVSYVRARSESMGVKCSIGFWQRPERIIALGTAAILTGLLNPLFVKLSYGYLHDFFLKLTLIVLAIGTNVTAIGRLIYVKRVLRERGMK